MNLLLRDPAKSATMKLQWIMQSIHRERKRKAARYGLSVIVTDKRVPYIECTGHRMTDGTDAISLIYSSRAIYRESR